MIKILSIDKIKENSIKSSIELYLKRLDNRLKVEIVEIPPAKYHTFDNVEKAKSIEAAKILEKINPQSLVVALDENGSQYTSCEFSDLIFTSLNHKHITFIIGGAYGLSSDILSKADKIISFSKMTFTHEMIRLFLIEQIYRAYTINSNIKYHH